MKMNFHSLQGAYKLPSSKLKNLNLGNLNLSKEFKQGNSEKGFTLAPFRYNI